MNTSVLTTGVQQIGVFLVSVFLIDIFMVDNTTLWVFDKLEIIGLFGLFCVGAFLFDASRVLKRQQAEIDSSST